MRLMKTFSAAALATVMAAAPLTAAWAQEEPALTQRQQEEVRKLIKDYLLENPEIIADSIQALREKQQLRAEADASKALKDLKEQIFNDPETPVMGNPKGDVTMVEFFDYRCTYCKAVVDPLLDLVKADGKVRLVMKELPILGPDSVLASRAALAAKNQKKYDEIHRALMKVKGPLNEAAIMKAAAEAGVNVEKLKKDMESPAVEDQLKKNFQLAQALNISGTPAFVLEDRIIPGAVPANVLKQTIETVRKEGAKK